jgi:hypothetical protein
MVKWIDKADWDAEKDSMKTIKYGDIEITYKYDPELDDLKSYSDGTISCQADVIDFSNPLIERNLNFMTQETYDAINDWCLKQDAKLFNLNYNGKIKTGVKSPKG